MVLSVAGCGTSGGQSSHSSQASLDIIPSVFPATSAEAYSAQSLSFQLLVERLQGTAIGKCVQGRGFTATGPSKPLPVAADNAATIDYPNVPQLESGSFGTTALPPGSFATPSPAQQSADAACAQQIYHAPPVEAYRSADNSVGEIWFKVQQQIYTEPQVTKSLQGAESCLAQRGVANNQLSLTNSSNANAPSGKLAEAHYFFNGTLDRLAPDSSQSIALAHDYGLCIAPTSALLDKLRLQARAKLLNTNALQVSRLLADANQMVSYLAGRLGEKAPKVSG